MDKDKKLFDANAEAAILSAIMVDNTVIDEVMCAVKEEYFYKTCNREIYRAIKLLYEDQHAIDIISIIDNLKSNGRLEKCGGQEYVMQVADMVVSGAHVTTHMRIIKEQYCLREINIIGHRLVEFATGTKEGVDAAQIISTAHDMLDGVMDYDTGGISTLYEAVMEALKQFEHARMNSYGVRGIPTGFHDLDSIMGGLVPGKIIVLAARPSMGKSALSTSICANILKSTSDIDIALFSMEMLKDDVAMRMLAAEAGINLEHLLKGRVHSDEKVKRLMGAVEELATERVLIDDSGSLEVNMMTSKLRVMRKRNPLLGLIAMDYLQLMGDAGGKRFPNRQESVQYTSRKLKLMALQNKMPVLLLCQLNREVDTRDDQRPRLSDLRESGAIEQDADVVVFLYPHDASNYKPGDGMTRSSNVVKFDVAKNRNGRTGTGNLYFNREYTRFDNYEMEDI